MDRGRKLKIKRYITSDSIFTKCDKGIFYVKGPCKASMKKERRPVTVKLSTIISKVIDRRSSCPSGKSGYCNHVMALLLEIADYSLSQFKSVPEEIACTNRLCQWGVPGETIQKPPVMETTIQKQPSSKGITSTLYDPRKVDDRAINWEKINTLKEQLAKRQKEIIKHHSLLVRHLNVMGRKEIHVMVCFKLVHPYPFTLTQLDLPPIL